MPLFLKFSLSAVHGDYAVIEVKERLWCGVKNGYGMVKVRQQRDLVKVKEKL